MKISIIIPAYNCEKFIARCLDSLFCQSGAELDIIVVNDGSNDGTLNILNSYLPRITVKTIKNSGSAGARNEGLKLASGDFIMFLDSDDYLSKDAVQTLVNTYEKTHADVIKFRYGLVFPDGSTKIESNQFDEYEVVEKDDFKKKIYPYFIKGIRLNSVCTVMCRSELLRGREFCEDMKVCEDAVFSLETYTRAKKVVLIPDVLYNYYQSGSGLTGSGASVAQKYYCNFIFAKKTVPYLKKWGMDSIFIKIMVYMRPLVLTFDKIRRILRAKRVRKR